MKEIDWHTAGIEDKSIQDGIDAETPTERRFETPYFVPVIPPVPKSTGYNAFDSFTDKDWEEWKFKDLSN